MAVQREDDKTTSSPPALTYKWSYYNCECDTNTASPKATYTKLRKMSLPFQTTLHRTLRRSCTRPVPCLVGSNVLQTKQTYGNSTAGGASEHLQRAEARGNRQICVSRDAPSSPPTLPSPTPSTTHLHVTPEVPFRQGRTIFVLLMEATDNCESSGQIILSNTKVYNSGQ